jgi:cold shock CspA family protein
MDEKKDQEESIVKEPSPTEEKISEVPEKPSPPEGPRPPVSLPQYSFQNLPDDKFSKGRIVKYFPQSRYGFIKDRRGKDLYFNVDEIRFMGPKGREGLKEGIVVGYDVDWTGHGLHIAKIKIY